MIHPFDKLDIPKADSRKFQLFVALVIDSIWLACNKLINEASHLNLVKTIQHLKVTLEHHRSAWKAVVLPSFRLLPDFGSFKGNLLLPFVMILLWQLHRLVTLLVKLF